MNEPTYTAPQRSRPWHSDRMDEVTYDGMNDEQRAYLEGLRQSVATIQSMNASHLEIARKLEGMTASFLAGPAEKMLVENERSRSSGVDTARIGDKYIYSAITSACPDVFAMWTLSQECYGDHVLDLIARHVLPRYPHGFS